eukprot:Sspe_Gene.87291::Locus_58398_Transcript_1_1_Confidence_1.000_Length_1400::g.87291::m.87291
MVHSIPASDPVQQLQRLNQCLGEVAKAIDDLSQHYTVVPEGGDRGVLGRGTYGVVQRCRRAGDEEGQLYAVKRMDKAYLSKKDKSVDQVLVEIAVLRALDHPRCIKLIDVLHTNDTLFVVMEYYKSVELYQYIVDNKTNGVPVDAARRVMQQLLEGLAYLHSKGVVHRDIKAENILIDPTTLNIKIIDFGLAKCIPRGEAEAVDAFPATPDDVLPGGGSTEVATTPCGTESYCPLEVITALLEKQQGWTTTATKVIKLDIYSAGVVGYAMLFGRLPYAALARIPNRKQRLIHLRGMLQSGPSFHKPRNYDSPPPDAVETVRRMMTNNVEERPSIAEVLGMEWFHTFEAPSTPTLAPQPRTPPTPCLLGDANHCFVDRLAWSALIATARDSHNEESTNGCVKRISDDRSHIDPTSLRLRGPYTNGLLQKRMRVC